MSAHSKSATGNSAHEACRTRRNAEARLKTPNTVDEKFEDVVKQAQAATMLVLVY